MIRSWLVVRLQPETTFLQLESLHALGQLAVQPYQSLIAAQDDSRVETSLLTWKSYQDFAAARVIGFA